MQVLHRKQLLFIELFLEGVGGASQGSVGAYGKLTFGVKVNKGMKTK